MILFHFREGGVVVVVGRRDMDAGQISAILDDDDFYSDYTEETARRVWKMRIEDVFRSSTPEVIADWFIHTDPRARNKGCANNSTKRACLVCAAVDGRPLDIFEALKDELTGEELAIAITSAIEENANDLQSIVYLVKDATNYSLREVAIRIMKVVDFETMCRIYTEYFPEITDGPDGEVIFSLLLESILGHRKKYMDFITSRVSGESFLDAPMTRRPAAILLVAVGSGWEDAILALARWLPRRAKTARVEFGRPEGVFTALELYRRGLEITHYDEVSKIVAALTVHTKGAHSS